MGTFKKGLFLGGLVGAGLMWLGVTKKGKEVREEVLEYATDVYGDVKKQILASETWGNLTKSKYVAMVHDAVDAYAIKTGIADHVKQMITRLVSAEWNTLEKELKKKKR